MSWMNVIIQRREKIEETRVLIIMAARNFGEQMNEKGRKSRGGLMKMGLFSIALEPERVNVRMDPNFLRVSFRIDPEISSPVLSLYLVFFMSLFCMAATRIINQARKIPEFNQIPEDFTFLFYILSHTSRKCPSASTFITPNTAWSKEILISNPRVPAG